MVFFDLVSENNKRICPMKNQSLHEALGPFLASQLGMVLTHQIVNGEYADFEFQRDPQKDMPGSDVKTALGRHYSSNKGVELLEFEEHAGVGALTDGTSVSHSFTVTIFSRRVKVTIEELTV